jgi:hypothetical protein
MKRLLWSFVLGVVAAAAAGCGGDSSPTTVPEGGFHTPGRPLRQEAVPRPPAPPQLPGNG